MNDHQIVRTLLNARADPMRASVDRSDTPLANALICGHTASLKVLLDKADLSLETMENALKIVKTWGANSRHCADPKEREQCVRLVQRALERKQTLRPQIDAGAAARAEAAAAALLAEEEEEAAASGKKKSKRKAKQSKPIEADDAPLPPLPQVPAADGGELTVRDKLLFNSITNGESSSVRAS